jgi:hypothetical protein
VTDFDLCFICIRRTTQKWSSFCETMEGHQRQAMQSKRWSTGLFVFSEVFFLVASLSLAMSLGYQDGSGAKSHI